MAVTITHTFASGTTINGDRLNRNFNDITSRLTQLYNADFSSTADIQVTKLTAYKTNITIPLTVRAAELSAGWPASGIVKAIPLPAQASSGDWECLGGHWVCTDIGSTTLTGSFRLVVGTYEDVGGGWRTSIPLTGIIPFTFPVNNEGAAGNNSNDERFAVVASRIRPSLDSQRMIAIEALSANTACLNLAGSFLTVTTYFKKDIGI